MIGGVRGWIRAAVALWVAGVTGLAAAAAAPPLLPPIRFTQYRLPNGLRVILSPDHSDPVVAVCVTYDVGSRNELPGHAGFAHLFEHLMFEGSAHVRPGQLGVLISGCGGMWNGMTTTDSTNYYEEVPKEQLRLALFLEADRMFSLRLDPETFDEARRIVEAEKRERHDRRAYDAPDAMLWNLAYTKFPNTHPAIGTVDDLEQATVDDAAAFYRTYYAPRNAILTIVGDFDPREAGTIISQYFSAARGKAPERPPAVDDTEAIPSERRVGNLRLARRALPRYYSAYRIPPASHPDYPALVLLSDILGDGRMSRCWRTLVVGGTASGERVSVYGRRGPGLFVFAVETPTRTPNFLPIATGVNAIVRRLQAEGVMASELERVRNLERVRGIDTRSTVLARCRRLGYDAVCFGRPQRLDDFAAALLSVTTADIRRVARKYLTDTNRVELFAR